MVYKFKFNMEPVAKARPRFTRYGHAYTPGATRSAEDAIREAARHLFLVKGIRRPITSAIGVKLAFYKPVLKSWSASRRAEAIKGHILPVSRPDLDNYIKLVMDALNGVVWADDSQVVYINASKQYALEPAITLEVSEL